jgi:rhamnosyltransferase
MTNTTCILITYNPDLPKLSLAVKSILANHCNLIIIDNSSSNSLQLNHLITEMVRIERLDKNYGIAYAQNHGIKIAIESNPDYIWLSDQDSIYEDDYATKMIKSFNDAKNQGLENIAAIGPVFYDTNREAIQPIVKFSPFTKKLLPKTGLNEVSHIIASGMFIPSDILKLVGLKDEKLFIDWVDMEWCWRASMKYGLKILVTGDVKMTHSLGDTNCEVFGYKIIIRSPFRHYFMVRNALALALHSDFLPLPVRLELSIKALIWTILFPILIKDKRYEHFKATSTAVNHGILNRLGPK